MQFSLRFKQLCKERGITQKQALTDMGFHRNACQSWSEGKPSAETLLKLSEYFGISTDEVLGVENKKTASLSGSGNDYTDIELLEAVMRADEKTKEVIRLLLKLK